MRSQIVTAEIERWRGEAPAPCFAELAASVVEGKDADAVRLTRESLDAGVEPLDLLNLGLLKGMGIVGEAFGQKQLFVPEVLVAARAMARAMDVLRPALTRTGVKPMGRAIIGTVQGDVHDIGKKLVAMMWEGAGLEVVNLGVNVAPEAFCAAVREHQPQIVAMSAMLTTTRSNMTRVLDALGAAGLRERVRVMVGGAPVDERFAERIGADGWAPNAVTAAAAAKKLLAERTA